MILVPIDRSFFTLANDKRKEIANVKYCGEKST